MTLGSLFDGSGGFPLAGSLCGITPLWAAEVEPYPIAVTRSRFPQMKHLGDVTKINGAEIEPVDVITFGSPCQDLSAAGKRAGLKHEANGDDLTTRSGLFMEAVHIIKGMRNKTNGEYPTFVLWENVPGAFSSNNGEDFRTVLEELIKIAEPQAVMPAVPKSGWAYADSYCGDGWSLAYRVFDAQYGGVPQRRRRIHLVVDFRGQRAKEILFERDGVRGYFAQGGTPRQAVAADAERSAVADDRAAAGFDGYNGGLTDNVSATLGVNCGMSTGHNGVIEILPTVYDARGNGDGKTVSTITGDHENRITDYTSVVCYSVKETDTICPCMSGNNQPVICLQGNGIDRADTAGCNGKGWRENVSYTLNTIDRPAVVYALDRASFNQGENAQYDFEISDSGINSTIGAKGPSAVCICVKPHYIVRRLTPTECARLQGFADRWGDVDEKLSFTPEEYEFWLNVRNTHAAINGKKTQNYTEKQMLTWYNKLHTDSAEYKMWGNGIALPPALYCMQGIVDAMERSKS